MSDEFLSLPNIIMPGEETVRKAVSRINKRFPNIFEGVKEIRIAPGGVGYGYVSTKDPGVIFLDFNKVKSTVVGRSGGANEDALVEGIISALQEVISHEIGHIEDNLQHGEFPAEQKARDVMRVMNACATYYKLCKDAYDSQIRSIRTRSS